MIKLLNEDKAFSDIQEACEEVVTSTVYEKVENFLSELSSDLLDNFAHELALAVPDYDPDWCAEEPTAYTIGANTFATDEIAEVLTNYIMCDLFYNKDISRWRKYLKYNI